LWYSPSKKFGVIIETDVLGWACCTDGRDEEYRVLVETFERKQPFRKPRLDRTTILK
jgi:hypothetical protein